MIALTVVFFKLHFPHPSLHTLPAILGVCCIIWFSNPNEVISKFLSSRLLVGSGLISYSLYLWHYPIFAFSRVNDLSEGDQSFKFLFVVVLVLSILTFYFIEKPAKNKNYNFKLILSIIIAFFLILLYLASM